jgi:hypothetical protein
VPNFGLVGLVNRQKGNTMSEMEMHGIEEVEQQIAVENEGEEEPILDEREYDAENEMKEYNRLKAKLKINEGDIFVQDNLTVMLNVLEITNVISGDLIYRVRLMATHLVPFNLSEVELYDYIANSGLTKLDTYRDFVEATTESMLLSEGEVYTQNGNEFIKIISVPFVYRGDDEIAHDVIGVEFSQSGSLELRNIREVKALVFGNSDQFAEMRGK